MPENVVISTEAADSFIVCCAAERSPHFVFAADYSFSCSRILRAAILNSMVEQAYVYILSSTFQKLYVGITTQIEVRTR